MIKNWVYYEDHEAEVTKLREENEKLRAFANCVVNLAENHSVIYRDAVNTAAVKYGVLAEQGCYLEPTKLLTGEE